MSGFKRQSLSLDKKAEIINHGVFVRFRRTFAEVITFGEASAHEF